MHDGGEEEKHGERDIELTGSRGARGGRKRQVNIRSIRPTFGERP